MKNILVVVLALGFAAGLFSCATGPKATSEIPERREFPVDPEVNACTDYFQHVCGKAIRGFKLREDRNRHVFSFSDSHERILKAKKDYLGQLLSQKKFNDKSQQLHDYYASCMDQKSRASEEKAILKAAVAKLNSIKTKKELISYMVQQGLEGKSSHLSYGNINNLDNSDIYDFIVMPARLASMPERSYYDNKELMAEFKSIAEDFFKLAGMDKAKERAQWVAEFESAFMKVYPKPAEMRPMWSKRAYSKRSKLMGYKNLGMGPVLKKVPGKIKIRNPLDKVFVYMNKAMNDYTLDQLKSVYLFQSTEGYLDEAFPKYYKRGFDFRNKYLGGSPKRAELSERCTQDIMARFKKEIDHELYDRFFGDFPEKKFISLLEKVRSSIIDGLVQNKWLSKKSKANAIKKVKAAKFQVVKPKTENEWDFNPKAKYDVAAYIANQKLLAKNLMMQEFERLPKPVDKTRWWMGPMTVNAYYSPTSNKFVMPAGILQYPFYDPKLPDWVNLGAVGGVVGHELGHGVDDQGSKYDEKGKVRQWMSKADVKKFKARGERLIAQFNEIGHDGKLTLGENIGDLVGVTFALNAAKKVMPVDPVARDVATKEFFQQWARAWCGVIRPKQREMRLKTDPHASMEARVNEQMKHQGDFARVYNCKPGDKLYLAPKDRVTIW